MPHRPLPRLLLTTGEPAGIGPELLVKVAQQTIAADVIAIGNQALLQRTAEQLGLPLTVTPFATDVARQRHQAGHLRCIDLPLLGKVQAGVLNVANAHFVLQQLQQSAALAINGDVDAIVTNPVQKSVINDAGIAFSGHTEFFAEVAGGVPVLMLLANDQLRVALATTHLPLHAVPAAITTSVLRSTLCLLHTSLHEQLGIAQPTIAVLGLNPHAGENGYLGREEIDVIAPTLNTLRQQGLNVVGPLSADTAFTPDKRARFDAYLAMYHDQGLPVLKALGFHRSVNITLGLPFIRTSVDHGTALDLAGKHCADSSSLEYAIETALQLIHFRK